MERQNENVGKSTDDGDSGSYCLHLDSILKAWLVFATVLAPRGCMNFTRTFCSRKGGHGLSHLEDHIQDLVFLLCNRYISGHKAFTQVTPSLHHQQLVTSMARSASYIQ